MTNNGLGLGLLLALARGTPYDRRLALAAMADEAEEDGSPMAAGIRHMAQETPARVHGGVSHDGEASYTLTWVGGYSLRVAGVLWGPFNFLHSLDVSVPRPPA